MTTRPENDRSQVKRLPQRAVYDWAAIDEIVDTAVICHVGFIDDGQPFVIPTIHVRLGDKIFLHGSPASRMLRTLGRGADACITVTHVDGLVLARSAFHHSMNYRSAVLFGKGATVDDEEQKLAVLRSLSERLVRGRWADVRPPSEEELRKTLVVSIAIDEASAKVRTGPPLDDEEDYAISVWAGVLPLRLTAAAPVADPRLAAGIALPQYITPYSGPSAP